MTLRTRLLVLSAASLIAAPAVAQTAVAGSDPTSAPSQSAAPTVAPAATPAPSPAPAAPVVPAAPAAAAPPAPAAQAAAAPPAAAGPVTPPPAGKGQIVFFRPSAFVGMAVWFKVRENNIELGKLSNGAYFVQVVDPGKHTFTAATENKDSLSLEVDDGETLYVKGGLSMGLIIAEANIAPSDAATFEAALKHMHLADPPPAAKAPTAAKTQGGPA